jgi:hypothetical protein
MNLRILLLLFITNFSFGQETIFHNPDLDLKNGEYYYLFGNDVKFRKLPDTNSEVIELLKIGTQIKIIGKSSKTHNYNGFDSHFYKVKFKNKVGYILGGLISIEKKENASSIYFFVYKKHAKFDYSIIIRHLNKNLELKEAEYELATSKFSLELHDNKGIEGIENVLYLNYLGDACGFDNGGIYYFQLENELKKVFVITQYGNEEGWQTEYLIFPNDEKGIQGKIVYQKELAVYKDHATNWVESKKTSRELKWENGEIIPRVESKNYKW